MTHVLTVQAYERKTELGGGFRGVVLDKRSQEKTESPIFPTMAEARYWAKSLAFKVMGATSWAPGYYRQTKSFWGMNVFTR